MALSVLKRAGLKLHFKRLQLGLQQLHFKVGRVEVTAVIVRIKVEGVGHEEQHLVPWEPDVDAGQDCGPREYELRGPDQYEPRKVEYAEQEGEPHAGAGVYQQGNQAPARTSREIEARCQPEDHGGEQEPDQFIHEGTEYDRAPRHRARSGQGLCVHHPYCEKGKDSPRQGNA